MWINPGVALVEPDFKMTFVAPCRCCRFDRLLCRMRLEKLAWRGETQIFVRRFSNEEFEKARSFEPPVTEQFRVKRDDHDWIDIDRSQFSNLGATLFEKMS